MFVLILIIFAVNFWPRNFLTAVYFLPQLVNFVSDIGGQLGLWIGFSVLTLAEFLELIMLLVIWLSRNASRRMARLRVIFRIKAEWIMKGEGFY